MKKDNKDKKMSAVQYLKTFEDTQAVIESIASKVETEQKSLMENMNPYGDSTDEGLFNMDNLLDVNLQDVENQPRMYNTPVRPLSDSDKSLIADEFANMLKNMRVDSVELEEIGPMSTAIAMKNGMIVTTVEEFINSLIATAVEKQDSQAIAQGLEEVPGMKEMETIVSPAPEVTALAVVSPEVSLAPVPEVMPEVSPVVSAEVPVELPVETPAAPLPEVMPEVSPVVSAEAPVEKLAEEKEHVALAGKLEEKAEEKGDVESKELASELKEGEAKEVEELEGKKEVPVEKSEEDEEKEVFSKLEAIKKNYKKAVIMEAEDKKLNTTLDSIKNKYLSTLTEAKTEPAEKKNDSPVVIVECGPMAVTTSGTATPVVEYGAVEAKPVVEGKKDTKKPIVEQEDMETSEGSDEDSGDLFENAKAQLESIVSEYHASEKAKEDKIKKDVEVIAKLESIATEYHSSQNAKKEAEKKDKEVTVQLESIAKSYLDKEKKTKLESTDARLKAKERIEQLKK